MKKLLLIVLLFLSIGVSQNRVNVNNLVKYGDKYFKENDDRPFNGIVFDMSKETGNKILEYKMVNGLKNGLHQEWSLDGKLKIKGKYLNGKRNGTWLLWFNNEQISDEITYKYGELISKKKWNQDGSFIEQKRYIKGSEASIAFLYIDVGDQNDLDFLEFITEEVIYDFASSCQGLVRLSEPSVTKKYKGNNIDLPIIARKIGVGFIFESNVQPVDSGFVFSARLYNSDAGKDMFVKKWFIEKNSLQSIVSVIVDQVLMELDIEKSKAHKRIKYDSEAYNLYLQSKSLYSLAKTADDDMKAIKKMESAISKDDNLVMAQIYLGTMQYDMGNYTQASVIYEKALGKSKSLQDNANIAESLRKQSQLLRKINDYAGSIEKLSEALSISSVMNDKSSMAKTLNSMAILNWRTNEKDEALKNWLEALSLAEELNDKPKISKYTNNIGIWYRDDSDFSRSVEYYEKSLKIKEELGDKRNMGKTLNNIGNIYFLMGEYENSIANYSRSIEIKEELQDNKGLAFTLNSIAKVYIEMGQKNKAVAYYKKSASLNNKSAQEWLIENGY